MGGGDISFNWAMKGNYPGLVDIEMDKDWMDIWPHISFPGLKSVHGADHASLTYYDSNQDFLAAAMEILERKQLEKPKRLRIWDNPPSEQYNGIKFCYDRQYNKGAALKKVIWELSSQGALSGRYRLITSGDGLTDSAMMNSQLRFPFDQTSAFREILFSSILPWNVFYLGSVVPYGAFIGKEGFRGALLPGINTVDAKEPNVLGIMDGVLRLLQTDKDL